MKPYLCLLSLLLLSCKDEPAKPNVANSTTDSITGRWDFNGDGTADNDLIINLNDGKGHAKDSKMPDTWTIIFSNKTLPNLTLTGGEPTPMGNGDVTGDGAAELVIMQAPVNGRYNASAWTFTGGKWKQLEEYHPRARSGSAPYFKATDLKRPYR